MPSWGAQGLRENILQISRNPLLKQKKTEPTIRTHINLDSIIRRSMFAALLPKLRAYILSFRFELL